MRMPPTPITISAFTMILTSPVSAYDTMMGSGTETTTVRIGSKAFSEQAILGNMYEMLLDDAGFDAEYTSPGGTDANHNAITNGEIDIYPEYTGTSLLTILEEAFGSNMTADDVYNTVKQGYEKQSTLTLLEPTTFNNTCVFATPEDRVNEAGISTVSDLSTQAGQLVLGTTQAFTEREGGLPGRREVYGGFQFQDVRTPDPGLLYTGINEGELDVTTGFGTDGQISAYNLVVLEDDKKFWPPYPVAPVIRQEVLDDNPEIAEVLNQLAPLLDDDTMSALNWEVAGNGREFLEENGLIE